MTAKSGDPIAAFWTWWKTARADVERALEARDLNPLVPAITEHVQAIDPGMKWELGGTGDALEFALSWEGDLRRRRLAQHWVDAAPKSTKWTYLPARPAKKGWADMTLEMGPHAIALGDFVCKVSIDTERDRANVTLFHAGLAKAPDNVKTNVLFLMLDSALGEDGVERYLGTVEFAKAKPKGAVEVSELIKAVKKLERASKKENFALLQGTRDELPLFVMKDMGLKQIDHLEFDAELAISMGLAEITQDGLPTKAEGDALDKLEDSLIEKLGEDAVYHGRETCDGARTLFFFVSLEGKALEKATAWKAKQKRAVEMVVEADPTWERLRRWG
jgi:hypothetical protein